VSPMSVNTLGGAVIGIERDGHVLVVELQRPPHNHFSVAMVEAIADALEAGARDVAVGAAVLVAHGLGCIQAAAWAATSHNARRVKGALLVAPLDVERADLRPQLPTWSPIALDALPFTSVVVGSSDDPLCDPQRTRMLAAAWSAQLVTQPASHHLNADSGLGSWPEGHVLLQDLMKD